MSKDDKKLYQNVINTLTSDPEKMSIFFKNMMDVHFDDEEYWEYICQNTTLTLDFIRQHHTDMNMKYVLKYQKFDDSILLWIRDNYIFYPEDYINMVQYQSLSVEMIQFYIDKIYPVDWTALATNQSLTSELIEKYHDKWDWDIITVEQYLTLEIIEKFSDKINWKVLPLNYLTQYLFNDSFIEYFKDKPFWDNIGLITQITLQCILDNKDRMTENAWYSVLIYMEFKQEDLDKLIEVLPENLDNDIVWDSISTHQMLTNEQITKYSDKLNWKYVSANQWLNWEIIEKYHDKISLYQLSRNDCINQELIIKIEENSNLFKDTLDKDLLSL